MMDGNARATDSAIGFSAHVVRVLDGRQKPFG